MSKAIKQMEMEALKSDFKGVRDMVVLNTTGLSCHGDYLFRAVAPHADALSREPRLDLL